ncbi:hypothetical protein GQ457_13G019510 [Hibiscus cannabinus]
MEYALRWRGITTQVQPQLTENELPPMFHDTLQNPFFDIMLDNSRDKFANLIVIGEMIEARIQKVKLGHEFKYRVIQEIDKERINVTSKDPEAVKEKDQLILLYHHGKYLRQV